MAEEEVSVTDPPLQKVVTPPAVIVGEVGILTVVFDDAAEGEVQPPEFV